MSMSKESSSAPILDLLPVEVDSSKPQHSLRSSSFEYHHDGTTSSGSSPALTQHPHSAEGEYFCPRESNSSDKDHWGKKICSSTTTYPTKGQVFEFDSSHANEASSSSSWEQTSSFSGASATAACRTTLEQPPKESSEITSASSSWRKSSSTETSHPDVSHKRSLTMPQATYAKQRSQRVPQVGKPSDLIDIFNQQRQESLAMLVPNPSESGKSSHVGNTAQLEGIRSESPFVVKAHQTPYDRYKIRQMEKERGHGFKGLAKSPAIVHEPARVDIDSWPVLATSKEKMPPSKIKRGSLEKWEFSSTITSKSHSSLDSDFSNQSTSRCRSMKKASWVSCLSCSKWKVVIVVGTLLLIAAAIAIGVVFGLKRAKRSGVSVTANTNITEAGLTPLWRPAIGSTWQIQQGAVDTLPTLRAQVYNIDLFDNNSTTIAALHELGRRVICSFSAGTLETWRPDASTFEKTAIGSSVQGSQNQSWLDTRQQSVRQIMAARIKLARDSGCDGVDPNHIDGYSSTYSTGFPLTTNTAADYVQYLANAAHTLDIAVGLHNAPELINETLDVVDWQLNEGCVTDGVCGEYQSFVWAGKPVFHIEYATNASVAVLDQACNANGTKQFSTLIKKEQLDTWSVQCPYGIPT
jgi:hypothetical protein